MSLTTGIGEYYPVLVAVVFVLSVALFLVAVRRSCDPRVRKSFISLFFVGLLVVNLAPLSPALPFSHLHKYTETSSDPVTYYDISVIDANGTELRYDGDAASPAGTLTGFGAGIATGDTESEANTTAAYLLDRGQAYRQRIEAGRGIEPYVDFPPHALGDGWDERTLSGYGEFVGLRVYYVEVDYTTSGLAVADRDRTLVATLNRGEFTRNGSR